MTSRILVVDDSQPIQKVIRIAFSRYDAEVKTASSYVEALTEVAQERPDILIVDAGIAGTKTVEYINRLVREAGQVPVLLLVGTHEHIDDEGLRSHGFRNILHKPFESQDIVSAVVGVLGQPIAEKTNTQVGIPMPPKESTGVHRTPPPPPVLKSVPAPSQIPTPPDLPPIPGSFSSREPLVLDEDFGDLEIEIQSARGGQAQQEFPPPPPLNQVDPKGTGSFSLIEEELQAAMASTPPPPPSGGTNPGVPLNSQFKPGTKAFSRVEPQTAPSARVSAPPPPPSQQTSGITSNEEMMQMVRHVVEEYCARHFPQVAREILTQEIRRLADERTRHLVDT